MPASISPSAGTESIVSTAMQQRITLTSGSAPTSPPTTARSRVDSNVGELFQLTAGLGAKLSSKMDGAEANRIQGGEGLDSGQIMSSVSEIKEKVDALKARAPSLSRFTDMLSTELDKAVKSGRGSTDRIYEVIKETQMAMAKRYGYVGHIIDLKA
jgi:hypothetical protein